MRFDVIILSYGVDDKMVKVTQDCINSLMKAEQIIKFDVLVLESGEPREYEGAKTVFYKKADFNYNHSLNFGISITKNKYILLCNNDLVFAKGFAEKLYNGFAAGYKSVSPYCRHTHPSRVAQGNHLSVGWIVGYQLAGWCIGVEREMITSLGGFNESVSFWYSDNIYADQLRLAEVKHALVCNAFVDHIGYGSQTLTRLQPSKRIELTRHQHKKYVKELTKLYAAKETVSDKHAKNSGSLRHTR